MDAAVAAIMPDVERGNMSCELFVSIGVIRSGCSIWVEVIKPRFCLFGEYVKPWD